MSGTKGLVPARISSQAARAQAVRVPTAAVLGRIFGLLIVFNSRWPREAGPRIQRLVISHSRASLQAPTTRKRWNSIALGAQRPLVWQPQAEAFLLPLTARATKRLLQLIETSSDIQYSRMSKPSLL